MRLRSPFDGPTPTHRAAWEAGGSTQGEIAERFDVGVATVVRMVARQRRQESLEPAANRGGRPQRKVDKKGEALVRSLVSAEPDLTIAEFTERYNEVMPVTISTAAMSRTLIRLGLTRKKSFVATEQLRPEVQRRRADFIRWQGLIEANRVFCIDETGSNIAMARRFGRAVRGQRVHDDVPRNRGKVTTLIGALTLEGLTAVMTVEGGTSSEVFIAYTEQVLCPELQPGDIVVLDNLRRIRRCFFFAC
ncbi:MAG: IS630 family transposase [Myxococcota bacterium]